MGDDRPARYEEVADGEEVVIYRASSVGRCIRELKAVRLGLQGAATPGWMQERYDDGNTFEPVIIERIARTDIAHEALVLLDESQAAVSMANDSQQEVEMRVYGNVRVRGHLDGTAIVSTIGNTFGVHHAVVEVKALGPSYWDSFLKKGLDGLPDPYRWQVSAYMHATGLACLLVCGQKVDANGGDGSNRDKEIGQVRAVLLREPPVPLKDFKVRLVEVETAEDMGACDVSQYPCPFSWVAGGNCEASPRVQVHDEVLAGLVEAYNNMKVLVSDAGREMRQLREAIKERMDALGQGDKLTIEGYNVSWRVDNVAETVVKAHTRTVLDIRAKKEKATDD